MQPLLSGFHPLAPIVDMLRSLLVTIQSATDLPWAWCIIILTCIVRIMILPFTSAQTRSMLAMQRLQPYMKQLQDRYKDDKQLLQQKMMEFYRDNRVNPMASCLPLLVQMPVFLALLGALQKFNPPTGSRSFLFGFIDDIFVHVKLAGAGGWTLVVIYVLVQLLSTKVMSKTAPPNQRVLMYILPLVFTGFLLNFSCGVMLYWIASGVWTIVQYQVIVGLHHRKPAVEIVLPEDTKGAKKTVMPKADKAAAGKQDASSKAGGSGRAGGSSGPARKNKRRR